MFDKSQYISTSHCGGEGIFHLYEHTLSGCWPVIYLGGDVQMLVLCKLWHSTQWLATNRRDVSCHPNKVVLSPDLLTFTISRHLVDLLICYRAWLLYGVCGSVWPVWGLCKWSLCQHRVPVLSDLPVRSYIHDKYYTWYVLVVRCRQNNDRYLSRDLFRTSSCLGLIFQIYIHKFIVVCLIIFHLPVNTCDVKLVVHRMISILTGHHWPS
jgi:hypothetical protein